MRVLVFDELARQVPHFGLQLPYEVIATADGGVEVDPQQLLQLCLRCLDHTHHQLEQASIQPAAVACCTFWHSIMGIDANGQPTTRIIHLFDTRSSPQARWLAKRLDPAQVHARTGAVLHPSYVPAKLLWLAENEPEAFQASKRWVSFGEYLYLMLFGKAACSTSMASGTGLWDQNRNDYDPELLELLPVRREQLAQPEEMDEPVCQLLPPFRQRFPLFDGIPWFPALGDGACNNVGSGCITPDRYALMVGTSGAMRAVFEAAHMEIPPGLWCYRLDRKRFVLGGALSNGGIVYEWCKKTLRLPDNDEEVDRLLEQRPPGCHGLTFLPFFAGERSPGWNPEARAAVTGMNLRTSALDLLQSALEAVALRFRLIYELMANRLGAPQEVVATGGALLRSKSWTQMMADALGRPVLESLEKEASSRGAAMFALERLGVVRHLSQLPAQTGKLYQPDLNREVAYQQMLKKHSHLYEKLFVEG